MLFLSADKIFDGYRFRSSNEVLAIQEDGTIIGFLDNTPSLNLKHYEGILVPGLINAHCHLELSYLKNTIAQGNGLVNFLMGINEQYKNKYDTEQIQKAIFDADNEMYQNGIVAVGDISNTLNTLECKKSSKMYYHTFVECMGLVEANADQRIETSRNIMNTFAQIGTTSLVLHAPYSVSDRLVELVNSASENTIQSIHMQECDAENELYENGGGDFHRLFEYILGKPYPWSRIGTTSLNYFLSHNNGKHSILVHNTALRAHDISVAKYSNKSISYCLCPKANLYIENKLPPVLELIESGLPIVIGTDSLASNNSLNLLEEVNVLLNAFPEVPLAYWLHCLTLQGAKSLGIEAAYGSFEDGKKPGIILLEETEGTFNPQIIQRIY